MKTLKFLTIIVGFAVTAELPAQTFDKCVHVVFRSDSWESKKTLPEQPDLLQTDFMAISAFSSIASNTIISENNSVFRNVVALLSALHGSAMACETWEKKETDSVIVIPLIFLNKFSPFKIENTNKVAATITYLAGQNAIQIADFFKGCWKAGLLNPMPWIRLFTKNRDRSELAAIAVRNLVPLMLFSEKGRTFYKNAKQAVIPNAEAA